MKRSGQQFGTWLAIVLLSCLTAMRAVHLHSHPASEFQFAHNLEPSQSPTSGCGCSNKYYVERSSQTESTENWKRFSNASGDHDCAICLWLQQATCLSTASQSFLLDHTPATNDSIIWNTLVPIGDVRWPPLRAPPR